MARIKYSALIESISGSIGGTTFQTNRYGFSIRKKPASSKPNTPSQNARKIGMSTVQQAWIALSDSERSSWNTYASTFPRATRKNINANLNGFNYFTAYHLIRQLANATIVTTPSGAQQTQSFDGTFIIEDTGVLQWESQVTLSGGNWNAFLFISAPVSATTQARKNRMRFVFAVDQTGSFTSTITTRYTDLFGVVPVLGDLVFVQEIWLNKENGQFFESPIQRIAVENP